MLKRTISVFLLVTAVIFMIFGDSLGYVRRRRIETEKKEEGTLILWYTDTNYGQYLRDAAVTYEKKTGIKVIPTEVSDVDYLEQIQNVSADGLRTPDMFMLSNDQLEKAVLSGLAGQTRDPDKVLNSAFYTNASLSAVTYRDRMYGYPLSYETACVIYNETVMEEIAKGLMNAETQEGDTEGITLVEDNSGNTEDAEKIEEVLTEEEKETIAAAAVGILPTTVVGILDFANNYNLPSDVKQYFLWDTEDVLYNYWFAGGSLNVGGENSDLSEEIDIYNEKALYSLSVYQDFKDFFSMGDEKHTYAETMDAFINRECIFTVAGTDIVSRMDKASAEGDFTDEYRILPLSMLNSAMPCEGLSVTTMVCINGMGEERTEAERFADFVTNEYAANLYARCEKMSAAHLKEYPHPQMKELEDYYEHTVALPKMVETSNYYILAEMCFSNIWNGRDVNAELKNLSESVLRAYYGKDFTQETIETPQVIENYNAVGEN